MPLAKRSPYGIFLDPSGQPDRRCVLDLCDDVPVSAVAEALQSLFASNRSLDAVTIESGENVHGVCTRQRLERLGGNVPHRSSEAERASSLGESTHYELLRYRCARCGNETARMFYDARDLPVCSEGHGAMESGS